jgi:4a-hydroxytetrahydrobiopterin dehydratase
MTELKNKKCMIFKKGTRPLDQSEIDNFKMQLHTEWKVTGNAKLSREFKFENFSKAMAFVQDIALIAETENHHPDICIYYNKVKIELSTHDVGGLSANDFIIAAKIEVL